MKKLIIAAGVILVILIIVTIFISSSKKNQTPQQFPTLIPTTIFETGGGPKLSEQKKQQLEQKVADINSHVLSTDQANRYDKIKGKLPVSNDDFAIGFSEALGQFFIQKKTPQADAALQKFFQDNNFSDVYQQFPDLFAPTNQPIDQAISQAEQNFTNMQQEFQQQQLRQLTPTQNPTSKPSSSEKQQQIEKDARMLKSFADFTGSLFTFSTGGSSSLQDILNSSLTPTQAPSGGGGSGSGGGGNSQSNNGTFTDPRISQALMDIFVEAGNRVNIAPKLLAAIMSRECATVMLWPQNQIVNHPTLTPGDFCYFNGFAYGPMQFAPGTWAGYATRVGQLVGHKANIENIQDAIFGAALKLKAAAQAKDPFNLTQQEVFRAASIYNTGHLTSSGGCANLSYCQPVWDYYNNH